MKKLVIATFILSLIGSSQNAAAWTSYHFDLSSGLRESAWRDALTSHLNGKAEVSIEGGRIDVLTDTKAIEVDWPHKWHEGLGQALHYADATGKQGVVALISYSQDPDNLKEKSRQRFEMVERLCRKNGIELMILFPSMSYEKQGNSAPEQINPKKNTRETRVKYWLNSKSGTRHKPGCHFYGNTASGYYCGPNEGKACSICGE